MREGEGTFTLRHFYGLKYIGEWKNDKPQGMGVITWLDGRKFEGNFSMGKKEGEGTFTDKNGIVATGTWKYDKH